MPTRRNNNGYSIVDSPFYKLKNRRRLAGLLNCSLPLLSQLASKTDKYTRRWKHKKKDQWLKDAPSTDQMEFFRPIDIPDIELKRVQKRISDLLGRIAPPEYLFSPVKGRSYVDNAALHLGSRAFKLLDIADFFPSCRANHVAWFFGSAMMCSPDVVAILVKLTTHNECLPQGSPCSPILAFFSNLSMWQAVEKEVSAEHCILSVYADDITISGKMVPGALVWRVKKIIHRHGFAIKPEKEVSLIDTPADITGVIVKDNRTFLPNRQLKKLRDLRIERRKTKSQKLRDKLDNQISGRLSQRRQVEK